MAERILVIGNCQAPYIAQVISQIGSGASVEAFAFNQTGSTADDVAKRLPEFDLVLAQRHKAARAGPLAFDELEDRHSCVVPFPTIIFRGFHPDFISSGDDSQIKSAAQSYHSLIVAAAYANRIPANRVAELFSPFTFARFGYFREYDRGKEFLLLRAEEIGYDLRAEFREWEASGVFMHTPNHPNVNVLVCIARKAAARAGLAAGFEPTEAIEDRLGKVLKLPVYPAVARRLNLPAAPSFKVFDEAGPREFDLSEYISLTYEMYETVPPEFFEHKSIRRVAGALRRL